MPLTVRATLLLILLCFPAAVAGCAGPVAERVRIEYKDVVHEVQRPCPVERPVKPGQLSRPLPQDAGRLVDLLTAKLEEWAGGGGYGDKADAALAQCTAITAIPDVPAGP